MNAERISGRGRTGQRDTADGLQSAAAIVVEMESEAYTRGYDDGYEFGRGVPLGDAVLGMLIAAGSGAIAGAMLVAIYLTR
ncbi:MAG: hypothetical protein WDM77_09815 [Steroidobacteraceae bacterium]